MSKPLHPIMVRQAIQRDRIEKKELASAAQVAVGTLRGVESDDWAPRWNTLKKLCDAADKIRRARQAAEKIMRESA